MRLDLRACLTLIKSSKKLLEKILQRLEKEKDLIINCDRCRKLLLPKVFIMKFTKQILVHSFLFFPIFLLAQKDWLIQPISKKAEIVVNNQYINLDNGLVKRSFYMGANLACIDYTNLTTGQQLLRSIEPEARVVINGNSYNVGGLIGQSEKAYLIKGSEKSLTTDKDAFQFKAYQIQIISDYIRWKPNSWLSNKKQPTGKSIRLLFISKKPELQNILISVMYNIYDGIPLITKWIEIVNNGEQKVKINRVVNEVLGLVEEESAVVGKPEVMKKQHGIYVETNYAFNNAMRYDISDQTTHWKTDSSYTSQVNYNFETPCLLEIYPERAPGIELARGETFKSVRTNELLMDSYDRQRRGLMLRKMYRTIAPWTTQNPIFMHLVSKMTKK
jgi:hypothetical protein